MDCGKKITVLAFQLLKRFLPLTTTVSEEDSEKLCDILHGGGESFLTLTERNIHDNLARFHKERAAELAFIMFLRNRFRPRTGKSNMMIQKVILDLPSLRLIDISADVNHKIQNYGVIFAPRAGHHSNVAERVALYMRDRGLTRMAIVSRNARGYSLYIDGERHYEGLMGR